MHKAAIIGDRESVSGFAALGLSVFSETDPEKISGLINELARSGYAIIYITESAAAEAQETISKYRNRRLPAIILIPGITGNTGDGMRNLHESVEKAVGSDILK